MASNRLQYNTDIENELSRSWPEWMGIGSPDISGLAPVPAKIEPALAFQPEEAGALYREVFEALQVPRRLRTT